MRSCWLFVLAIVVGCGSVGGTQDAAIDARMFTVGGSVSGFAGSGLVLRLNGANDLPITGDGAFSFPATFADGASYTVTVAAEATCPHRICTLTNATGMVAGANPSITVSCAVPRFRLASHNWGAQTIRITDDPRHAP